MDYIYGTFLALRGLKAGGVSDREAPVQRALEWVRAIQNFDGGWGESCASYNDNGFVAAPSTPSQTAWAILALLAGGDTTSTTLHDGVDYLIRTQNRRRKLGRRSGHRHRVPQGLLPFAIICTGTRSRCSR